MEHGSVNRELPLPPSGGVIDVTSDGDEVRIRHNVRRPNKTRGILVLLLTILLAVIATALIAQSKLLRDVAPIVNTRSILTASAGGLIGLVSLILLIKLTPFLEPAITFLISRDDLLVRRGETDLYRIPRSEITAVRIVRRPPQWAFDLSQPVSRVIQRRPHPMIQFVTPYGIVHPLNFDSTDADSAARHIADAINVPIQEMDLAQARAADANVPSTGALRLSADDRRWLTVLWAVIFGFVVLSLGMVMVELRTCWWTHAKGTILFIVRESAGDGEETFYRYAYLVEGRWHLNNDKWPPMEDAIEEIESYRPQSRLGSKVDVYYNPSDPTESTLRPYTPLWRLASVVLLMVFFLVLLYALWRVEPAPDQRELEKRYVCKKEQPNDARKKRRKPSQPPPSVWRMFALFLVTIIAFHLICEWALPAAWRKGWFPECRTEAEFREITMTQLHKGTLCALVIPCAFALIGLLEIRLKAKLKKKPSR